MTNVNITSAPTMLPTILPVPELDSVVIEISKDTKKNNLMWVNTCVDISILCNLTMLPTFSHVPELTSVVTEVLNNMKNYQVNASL